LLSINEISVGFKLNVTALMITRKEALLVRGAVVGTLYFRLRPKKPRGACAVEVQFGGRRLSLPRTPEQL
jgi:hypothetical protein